MSSSADSTRTLVVHAGGIGDFLLTCPTLEHLAERGSLELAGRPERLRLALAGGIADAVHDLEDIDFHSLFVHPSARLNAFLQRFSRVIVWMRDDGTLRSNLQRAGVPEVDVFPGLPPPAWARHASEYYLEQLGLEARAFRLSLEPAGEPLDIVIHPGSGSKKKNWPLHHLEELATRLAQQGRRVTWCCGPAEGDLPDISPADLLHEPDLTALGTRLAAARLYVGNDSGITHLAAAVGCPTVAIFGTTDPQVWAPRGAHVHVVTGKPWPTVGEVLGAVVGWNAYRRSAVRRSVGKNNPQL